MKDLTPTLTEQRKSNTLAVQAQIIELLGWTEMEYCEFKYEQGLEYLYEYLKKDAYLLESNRIFWNWWKNHWTLRDEELLRSGFALRMLNPSEYQLKQMQCRRMAAYLVTHDGNFLASEMYPTRVVMDQSYQEMVSQVIAKETANKH